MKNILIIQGNPVPDSFCQRIAVAYRESARSQGAIVEVIEVGQLQFQPNLAYGYRQKMEMEDDLIRAQQLIKWADHLVFVYPTWWGTMPGILKGFIDRVFLPGFAFQYKKGSEMWDKLLKGKSARVIVTMDAPAWYYYLMQGAPGHKAIKRSILQFCGVNPVRITTLSSVRKATQQKRNQWIQKVEEMGAKLI